MPTRNACARTARVVPALLDWFSRHARDLPWRRTRNPYMIWVSEIMLQQTQVKTVIPYFERWLRELPDIEALARADLGRLHKLWEGLGYYTRVRNLQKAAMRILDLHGGQFPSVYDQVLALPGVGRYTAGAICSIAFDQPRPILDGNVIRVLTRVFGIDGDTRETRCNQELWRLAGNLVQRAGPGNRGPLNEALMELGALVCTPRAPDCLRCPVARHCVARRQRRVDQLPGTRRRPSPTRRRCVAFVLTRGDRVLVRQRRAGTVNGLLWEFPSIDLNSPRTDVDWAARRLLGVHPQRLDPLCTIKHSITRYRITLDVYSAIAPNGVARHVGGRWIRLSDALQLSFPSAHRRILGRVATGRNG